MTIDVIEERNGRYTVYVTTRGGKRFWCDYATEPTKEEVENQWKTDRRWFTHIN
jgi:hypothetical protein